MGSWTCTMNYTVKDCDPFTCESHDEEEYVDEFVLCAPSMNASLFNSSPFVLLSLLLEKCRSVCECSYAQGIEVKLVSVVRWDCSRERTWKTSYTLSIPTLERQFCPSPDLSRSQSFVLQNVWGGLSTTWVCNLVDSQTRRLKAKHGINWIWLVFVVEDIRFSFERRWPWVEHEMIKVQRRSTNGFRVRMILSSIE